MKAEEFKAELNKYELKRKIDHYKVKWNRKTHEKREVLLKEDMLENTTIDPSSVASDAGFWEVLESASKSIFTNTTDMNQFFNALRMEHNAMSKKINLTDLNALASHYSSNTSLVD